MKLWEACELALEKIGRPANVAEIATVIEDMEWFSVTSIDSVRCQIKRRLKDYNGADKIDEVFERVGTSQYKLIDKTSTNKLDFNFEAMVGKTVLKALRDAGFDIVWRGDDK